jgi:hypothetical protein
MTANNKEIKTNKMKNKTVIRKELKKNEFTSIHNQIINDKRISSNAFRLLTSILSDNDETFKLSQTTYCNRLGWEPTMFKRAIENLIECGYVKRTLIDKPITGIKKANSNKKLYFYTISEYGNLKQESSTEKVKQESKFVITEKHIDDVNKNLLIITKELNKDGFDYNASEFEQYFIQALKDKKITSLEQLSFVNLKKLINNKFKIKINQEQPKEFNK